MAPYAGFDTDHVKDKARKDLLYLLEGVSKHSSLTYSWCRRPLTNTPHRFVVKKTWS